MKNRYSESKAADTETAVIEDRLRDEITFRDMSHDKGDAQKIGTTISVIGAIPLIISEEMDQELDGMECLIEYSK